MGETQLTNRTEMLRGHVRRKRGREKGEGEEAKVGEEG